MLAKLIFETISIFFSSGTKNSEIEYTLFGELYENFTINSHTGTIEPKYPVDFELLDGSSKENVRTLLLTIRAKDLGYPSLFSDVPLVVYVQDVNDNAPIFEYNFYNRTILENITEGTSILKVTISIFIIIICSTCSCF